MFWDPSAPLYSRFGCSFQSPPGSVCCFVTELPRLLSGGSIRGYRGRKVPQILEQAWDSISVAVKVLALSIAALIFAFIVPGLGLVLGWAIASYAIGRGLFVAVAMRRMSRSIAESIYLQYRGIVLAQGGVLALAAYIPLLNLLIPVVGTAAMVHILDMALASEAESGRLDID